MGMDARKLMGLTSLLGRLGEGEEGREGEGKDRNEERSFSSVPVSDAELQNHKEFSKSLNKLVIELIEKHYPGALGERGPDPGRDVEGLNFMFAAAIQGREREGRRIIHSPIISRFDNPSYCLSTMERAKETFLDHMNRLARKHIFDMLLGLSPEDLPRD
jgi:hypothetical protein